MDNKQILYSMVEQGYNDLYLELADAPDISDVLKSLYNMTDKDINDFNFRIADDILKVSLGTTCEGPNDTVNIKTQKYIDDNAIDRTERYQLWMAILMITLFGITTMLLIFQPIPNTNDDLLVVLATWLGKDVTTIIQYHHGTSYSSLLKTKSMIRVDNENISRIR